MIKLNKRNITNIYLIIFLFISCIDLYVVVLGLSFKLLYFVSIPLLVAALFHASIFPVNKLEKWLYLWLLSYFFSIGNLISVSDWIITVLGQIVLILIYKGIIIQCSTKDKLKYFEHILIIGFSIIVMIGILQFALYYALGITWGISHQKTVGLARPRSLTLEPDWYGLICMILSIYMVIHYAANKRVFKSNRTDIVIMVSSLIGLIISMARATWLGFAFAMLVFLVCKIDKKTKKRILKIAYVALASIVVALILIGVASPQLFINIFNRINIFQSAKTDGGATATRISSIEIMLHFFKLHPITGNGVGGMNAISTDSELLASLGYFYEINAGRGNANIIITNLFDVGIIGTLFLLLFFIEFFKMMIKCYKKTKDLTILCYIFIFIALLTDFQFNNGIRQAYVWILLGFAVSRYRLLMRSQSSNVNNRKIVSKNLYNCMPIVQ